jgi:hypothetical protein
VGTTGPILYVIQRLVDLQQHVQEVMVYQWKVIAFVLADMTEEGDSVPAREIYSHPIIQSWYAQSNSAPTSHIAQIDRRLQEKTSLASKTVGSQPRREPFLFDKTNDAKWYLTPEGRAYVLKEIIPIDGAEIEARYGQSERLIVKLTENSDSPPTESGYTMAIRAIKQRRGQPEFRRKLISAYQGCCSFTGSNATEALEAAHIIPVVDDGDNEVNNGILLRADVHTLFDLGMVTVNPESMRIELSEILRDTDYAYLHHKKMVLPGEEFQHPLSLYLTMHYSKSRSKNVYG